MYFTYNEVLFESQVTKMWNLLPYNLQAPCPSFASYIGKGFFMESNLTVNPLPEEIEFAFR